MNRIKPKPQITSSKPHPFKGEAKTNPWGRVIHRRWKDYDDSYQLPIFTDDESRILSFKGKAHWWWLRSLYYGSSCTFCYVYSGGSYDYGTTGGSGGVVVGFDI